MLCDYGHIQSSLLIAGEKEKYEIRGLSREKGIGHINLLIVLWELYIIMMSQFQCLESKMSPPNLSLIMEAASSRFTIINPISEQCRNLISVQASIDGQLL